MYEHEEIVYDDDVLFPWIPVCIVLTTVASKRRQQYLSELNKFKPCKRIIIQHNPTFKKVYKENVTRIDADILHSLQHAVEYVKHYPYVLVLEDDCRFVDQIQDERVRKDVFHHLENGSCDIYSLGSMILTSSFNYPHIHVLSGGAAHALIYTKKAMLHMLQMQILNSGDLYDCRLVKELRVDTYKYPLAIQNHSLTENMKEWSSFTSRCIFIVTGAHRDGTLVYNIMHELGAYGGAYKMLLNFRKLLIIIIILLLVAHIYTHAFLKSSTSS